MPPLRAIKTPTFVMETDAVFSHETGRAADGLSDALLAQHLAGVELDRELVAETTSTNSDLVARARSGAPARPVLRVAQRQTQGRGRRGRRWHGVEGGSLLFSLAIPWQRSAADSTAVTLACGLAVAALLREHLPVAGERVRVKWPNDILFDQGKLAGILVEFAEDAAGARTLVVGLGINLVSDTALLASVAGAPPGDGAVPQMAPGDSAAMPVADLATALGAAAVLAQREIWLARLARALLAAARRFDEAGFAGGPDVFAAHCAYLGNTVVVHGVGNAPLAGVLRGVDAHGRLLIETAHGVQALSNGEVSVRAARAPLPGAGGSVA
jgi:BirA family biotin operon repressor/biotin-[acetyl-CoA-carboxylase] ligase